MLLFKDYLQEIKLTLKCHDELNNKLWNGEKLKPDVRKTLITFAETWASFAKIPKSMFLDIIMTGGNANFDYTNMSDIDVHIICDRSKLFSDPKFVEEYLQSKKSLWTLTHKNVNVYGYPLEPYAQDVGIKYPKGQGVYSLKKDEWLQKPTKCDIDPNDVFVKQKVKHFMHVIDHMINHNMGADAFNVVKDKLKNLRGSSIAEYGEYGRDNLVFKELRNRGYLDKMNNYQISKKDKELSLN